MQTFVVYTELDWRSRLKLIDAKFFLGLPLLKQQITLHSLEATAALFQLQGILIPVWNQEVC